MSDYIMDRAMLSRHLQQAEALAAEGLEHIAMQRRVIANLERGGLDTKAARDLLATYLETQELHERHRDRLRMELGLAGS